MPRGRRPGPGTAEEKAAARREKVRLNVQAYRKRKHEAEKDKQVAKEPNLKWVEDTKWQQEYDQHSRSGRESEADQDSKRSSFSGSLKFESADEDVISAEVVARTPQMYNSPSAEKQNTLQILSMFTERFLPDQLSMPSMFDVQTIRTPCALWVTTAARQARLQDSGALNDVLHSIVMAVISQEHQRPDLTIEAHRLYTRSLNKTRRGLGPILANSYKASKTDILNMFLACHAAAVYEMIANGNMTDMRRHILGIGLLIEHQRCMPDFPTVTGNSLVEEYRMMEIHFCLLERRLSTTCRMKGLTPEPARISHSEAIMNTDIGLITTLLDLADQILPIMVELDSFKETGRPSAGHLMRLVQSALSLHAQFDSWSNFLHNKAFPGSPHSDASSDAESEPLDLCQITQYEYVTCYLFSLSYDLHAIEMCIEAVTALTQRTEHSPPQAPSITKPSAQQQLLRTQSLAVAGTMLELMPYLFQQDKGIIGRSIAIWPLEAVWRVLDNESSRLSGDEHVAKVLNVSDDFKNKIKQNRILVEKYYKLCRQSGRTAQAYGLPLIQDRDCDDFPNGCCQGKQRVHSIDTDEETSDVYVE
jgi:hypothetical protein